MSTSKWRENRERQKKKLRWPTGQRQWIRRWRKSLAEIGHRAEWLLHDQEIYLTCRKIVSANPNLDKQNEFFFFIDRTYWTHMLVGLRSLDDTHLKSHSLYNLIDEILDHREQITKDWHLRPYPRSLRTVAEQQFRSRWGSGQWPSKRILQRDRRTVSTVCHRIRAVVNKHIAHNARSRRRMRLRYSELDSALGKIFDLAASYSVLLNRTSHSRRPLPPWQAIFEQPWRLKGDSA